MRTTWKSIRQDATNILQVSGAYRIRREHTGLISTFEEKQQLVDLVTGADGSDDNTGVQVYIGDELPISTMKDCSVVTATYELGEGMHGTIGIVGPKRMDYETCSEDSLKTLKVELDQVFIKNKSNE